jgi:hypothetical protein
MKKLLLIGLIEKSGFPLNIQIKLKASRKRVSRSAETDLLLDGR